MTGFSGHFNKKNPSAIAYWHCTHGENIDIPCADKVILSKQPICPQCRGPYKIKNYQRIHKRKCEELKRRAQLGKAIISKNPNFIKIHHIINSGVDFSTADYKGNTLLHAVCLATNNPYLVKFALHHGGMSTINKENDEGITPLHCAARKGRNNVIKELLDRGAMSSKDKYDKTPLDYALKYGNEESIELLLVAIT